MRTCTNTRAQTCMRSEGYEATSTWFQYILNLTTRMAHRSIMEEIQSWETELEELIRNGHLKCLDQSTNQDLTEMSHRHGGLLPQGTRESVFYSKYSSKWQQARQHILVIEHILVRGHILVREHILERIYSKCSSGPAQLASICTLGFFDSCSHHSC